MLHQLEPPSQVLLGLSTAVTAVALPYVNAVNIQSAAALVNSQGLRTAGT